MKESTIATVPHEWEHPLNEYTSGIDPVMVVSEWFRYTLSWSSGLHLWCRFSQFYNR